VRNESVSSVPSSLPSLASGKVVAALLALSVFAPGAQAAAAATGASGIQVVGSGHLNENVVVRSAPQMNARRVTVLREFRSHFRPQVILALAQRKDPDTGEPTWYRISVPGRPNGRTGWIQAEAATDRKSVV
jgi:hypothetical protein